MRSTFCLCRQSRDWYPPRFVFIKHTTLAKADGLPEFGGSLESLSVNLAPDGMFELQEASLDNANGRVPLGATRQLRLAHRHVGS